MHPPSYIEKWNWTQKETLVKKKKKNDLSFISVYLQPFLQPFLLNDAYGCYFLDPVTNVFVSGVPMAVTFSQFINQEHNHKILAYFPHKKIHQCLTDINQCLTNIGHF